MLWIYLRLSSRELPSLSQTLVEAAYMPECLILHTCGQKLIGEPGINFLEEWPKTFGNELNILCLRNVNWPVGYMQCQSFIQWTNCIQKILVIVVQVWHFVCVCLCLQMLDKMKKKSAYYRGKKMSAGFYFFHSALFPNLFWPTLDFFLDCIQSLDRLELLHERVSRANIWKKNFKHRQLFFHYLSFSLRMLHVCMQWNEDTINSFKSCCIAWKGQQVTNKISSVDDNARL